MLLPEKYESIFKILSYFSGRSIPNLLRRYLRSLYLHWQLLFMNILYTMYNAIDKLKNIVMKCNTQNIFLLPRLLVYTFTERFSN